MNAATKPEIQDAEVQEKLASANLSNMRAQIEVSRNNQQRAISYAITGLLVTLTAGVLVGVIKNAVGTGNEKSPAQ